MPEKDKVADPALEYTEQYGPNFGTALHELHSVRGLIRLGRSGLEAELGKKRDAFIDAYVNATTDPDADPKDQRGAATFLAECIANVPSHINLRQY